MSTEQEKHLSLPTSDLDALINDLKSKGCLHDADCCDPVEMVALTRASMGYYGFSFGSRPDNQHRRYLGRAMLSDKSRHP